MIFFFNDTATTEIYTLSLHDALPICAAQDGQVVFEIRRARAAFAGGQIELEIVVARRDLRNARCDVLAHRRAPKIRVDDRSEEHTSELQSRQYLVCRLLLEKKNTRPY